LSGQKKIISVVGARPNFIKLAPVHYKLIKENSFSHIIVHTGQHYDYNLSKIFFKDLQLPEPDIYLNVGSSSHANQTAKIMSEFESVLKKIEPDLVIVYGDVNSTLACSLACSKFYRHDGTTIPVAHIESGLRSFDKKMPEEINRLITDNLSDLLFVTENAGVRNLKNEGISLSKIHLVGDVMIDSLKMYFHKFESSDILERLKINNNDYSIVTIHRPVNTDNIENLTKIISIFKSIFSRYGKKLKIIFPVHPRTKKMLSDFLLMDKIKSVQSLVLTDPFSYTDFIKLLSKSKFVLTDSGGIQSEATFLKIPCLTLRKTFEKPETLKTGPVTLCSLNKSLIISKIDEILKGNYKKFSVPKLMDGHASDRIIKILKKTFK
jgi:UDP-N-acetylglucosamine 2-epimerase (non-hydrolysing)